MRLIDDAERRARLGQRHGLANGFGSVEEVARALVAVHGSDPATTALALLARSTATLDDVQSALYEDRTLVRVMAMRRTVFAVPTDLVTTFWAGSSDVVAREQRRLLAKMLVDSDVTNDPVTWIRSAQALVLDAARSERTIASADLAAAEPLLVTRLDAGMTVASRLLTVLSAEGALVRAQARGGWTSSQFRWSLPDTWCGELGAWPSTEEAAGNLARRWLRTYGPAHLDDVQWWFGWTKTRTRAALATLELAEVQMDGRPGLVLADDVEPVGAPDPWVALLPALDPSIMAWKHRDFVLGRHRDQLFDATGNAGPTVWVDGRIVGGWAHRDTGEIAVELFDDVGTAARTAIHERAAALSTTLGDVRLKARARRWTPSENRLRA
ncbi:winged helix DNA-binding domain-containing protein [Aeromicrobium sp. CF3.5]|uniref:winged helix DNA-binding domain-containing protein n=1 Tax=Aeromicrobium sp. CF3.5 TaxID=3373078 RepID=UPI003EE66BA7